MGDMAMRAPDWAMGTPMIKSEPWEQVFSVLWAWSVTCSVIELCPQHPRHCAPKDNVQRNNSDCIPWKPSWQERLDALGLTWGLGVTLVNLGCFQHQVGMYSGLGSQYPLVCGLICCFGFMDPKLVAWGNLGHLSISLV